MRDHKGASRTAVSILGVLALSAGVSACGGGEKKAPPPKPTLTITAATVVTRSILKPGQYSGLFPFDDNASWEKNAATLRQLHTLRDRIRALEKKTP